jgi:Fic family protein
MKSFEPGFLERQPITHNLLRTVRLLGEFKGKEDLFKEQFPQALETLRQVAIVQSTESSSRIEGVTAPAKRIQALVAEKTTPRNRSEQEIAGYRDALNTIHANQARMPVTTGVVLQLHRDLFRYADTPGGRWKPADNQIVEIGPDGTRRVRFQPVPAFLTSEYMEALHARFRDEWQAGEIDKLLLIPAYVLDFLCIHPFSDGNGRIARLLTLLLLYHAGFDVGRYVSLEKIIEQSKESYYDSLYQSSQGWHEGRHALLPWTEYLLGVLIAAYREFEARVGTLTVARGAKTQLILEAVRRLPDGFRMVDLERQCPNVSRDMIRVVLDRLKKDGAVWREGAGAGAVWRKRGNIP